jgi:hypothetical protein
VYNIRYFTVAVKKYPDKQLVAAVSEAHTLAPSEHLLQVTTPVDYIV